MSITSTILACWDDLSAEAQAHIMRTRLAILTRWDVSENGMDYDRIDAPELASALAQAVDQFDRWAYDTTGGTVWVRVQVRNVYTSETDSTTIAIDPPGPDCSQAEHDWQSPHEVVGGLTENPGVWGHGGGVVIRQVCAHCGVYRRTDTWAQDPGTGEQGLTSVRYLDADEASHGWISSLAATDDE